MKNFWDERFSSTNYLYGKEPNSQFKEFIDSNKPGKILLPGEGEGRNAVYAAKKGWKVSAIDLSKTGREKALLLAKENGVSINYVLEEILLYQDEKESYDAIALVFFHLPPELRLKIHQHLITLLKPQGKLLIIGFSTEQLNYQSGGPKNIEMLYTKELLNKDFDRLRIERNEQITASLTEGIGHEGEASLIWMQAIKEG